MTALSGDTAASIIGWRLSAMVWKGLRVENDAPHRRKSAMEPYVPLIFLGCRGISSEISSFKI